MKRPQHVIVLAAAAVIILLTAGAFALSYAHLHDVAHDYGLSEAWRAWAWPGCLDAFIVAGELLMLRAALRRTVDGWAIGLTASGSLGSIGLNVAGVGADAAVLAYIVAAVPPAAALLAFGALMRQVHEYLAAAQPVDATPVAPAATHNAPQPVRLPAPPAPFILDLAPMQQPHPDLCAPVQQLRDAVDEAMRPVAEDTETVALLTVADVAAAKGVAEGTVRSWVNRNKLSPVRRGDDGRLHFHPATVAALD